MMQVDRLVRETVFTYLSSWVFTGSLNDLWQYSTTTGLWTWLSGDTVRNQVGTYGTMGVASVSNVIGGRGIPCAVMASSNTLLVFGGYGYGASGTEGTSLHPCFTF